MQNLGKARFCFQMRNLPQSLSRKLKIRRFISLKSGPISLAVNSLASKNNKWLITLIKHKHSKVIGYQFKNNNSKQRSDAIVYVHKGRNSRANKSGDFELAIMHVQFVLLLRVDGNFIYRYTPGLIMTGSIDAALGLKCLNYVY